MEKNKVLFICRLLAVIFILMACRSLAAAQGSSETSLQSVPEPTLTTTLRDLNKEAIEQYQRGEVDKALDTIHRAILSDPQNAEYHFNEALMLYKTGKRYVDAKKSCEDVLTLKPDHEQAKVLLKGCLEKILQSEGVKNETALATSKFIESQSKVRSVTTAEVPEEVKTFLKLLYLDQNYDEAYVYFCEGAKKALSQTEFTNYMKNTFSPVNTGIARDVKITSMKIREKEYYGFVKFETIYEKELKQPLKTAIGGYNTVLEKKRNFMFFQREEEKWVVLPPDFIIDKFIFYCGQFPDILNYVGTEMKIDNEWKDSNLLELEKMGEFLESKKPEDAIKMRIMTAALSYLKAWKDKDYAQMYEFMASLQKNMAGRKNDFIKTKSRDDIRTVIRDIRLQDVATSSRVACVKFSVEMFNNVGGELLALNKLNSYLMVVKDGVEWRVVEWWRTKKFLENYPVVYKEFGPGEDQYLEHTGKDWTDRSLEYNAMRRELLTAVESKIQ